MATDSATTLFTQVASSTGAMIGSSIPIWLGVVGFAVGFLFLIIVAFVWKKIFKGLRKGIGF